MPNKPDISNRVIIECDRCKAKLRVPTGKIGIIECPRCHSGFNADTRDRNDPINCDRPKEYDVVLGKKSKGAIENEDSENQQYTKFLNGINIDSLFNCFSKYSFTSKFAYCSNTNVFAIEQSKKIDILSMPSGRLVNTITIKYYIETLEFSVDGRFLISSSNDRIDIWLISTGKLVVSNSFLTEYIKLKVAKSWNLLRRYEKINLDLLIKIQQRFFKSQKITNNNIYKLFECFYQYDTKDTFAYSDNQHFFAVQNYLNKINIISLSTSKSLGNFEIPYYSQSIKLSNNATWVITTDNYQIDIWSVKTGKLIKTIGTIMLNRHHIELIELSPDSKFLVGRSLNGEIFDKDKIYVWSIPEGKIVNILSINNFVYEFTRISPDSQLLVNVYGFWADIWSISTKKLVRTIKIGNGNQYNYEAVSRDGKNLMKVCGNKIKLYSLWTSELIRILEPKKQDHSSDKEIHLCSFSHNSTLIIANYDSSIYVWSVSTGKLVQIIPTKNNFKQPQILKISTNNELLACSYDRQIDVWSILTRKIVRSLIVESKHKFLVDNSIESVDFDSNEVISIRYTNGNLKYWSLKTGEYSNFSSFVF